MKIWKENEKLYKWTTYICLAILALFMCISVRAEEARFSDAGDISVETYLQRFIESDDIAVKEIGMVIWLDGFLNGVIATYTYQTDSTVVDVGLTGCINELGLTATGFHKLLLSAGANPIFKGVTIRSYVYGLIHMYCPDTFGEYELSGERESS